ncbi:hypothetical protein FOPG_16878 [Fusarium oxysporum f. sp. conglutinans race 2 54008]|uniref:Uncharacterized protein n=1 Tax=Fusarium oxysporum f. sp. conglutinans race 2 54008 TaxID=1089457 RepID=X0H4S0_FUSOX|nr:hypothetical protein FOPG_16878 [Fusarium oxysporum f. sp. conglutinans race 2 54008]
MACTTIRHDIYKPDSCYHRNAGSHNRMGLGSNYHEGCTGHSIGRAYTISACRASKNGRISECHRPSYLCQRQDFERFHAGLKRDGDVFLYGMFVPVHDCSPSRGCSEAQAYADDGLHSQCCVSHAGAAFTKFQWKYCEAIGSSLRYR